MSGPALTPRPDQVAELTRGLDLPLPAIGGPIMIVLAEAIAAAFSAIRIEWPQTLATGTEPEVTALLVSRLNAMADDNAEEAGLWRSLVRCVGRSDECISYDGAHLEKQPDLSIWLTDRSARFPLMAEAKLLDTSSGKTEALYCSQGVRRFLVGEYGWGGREAFMLGYVRDGSTIPTKLAPYFGQATHAATYSVEVGPITVGIGCDSSRSQHGRNFAFSHLSPPDNAPGPIDLWHVWLQAN